MATPCRSSTFLLDVTFLSLTQVLKELFVLEVDLARLYPMTLRPHRTFQPSTITMATAPNPSVST